MTDVQTEIQAQATESQKLTNNKEILAYLAEKFPLCFILEGEAKPLKIGLFQELAEVLKDDERVSKTQLRQALRQYTSNWRYLHGCREGAVRVDLQGNPAGILEAEHVAHAAQQLAEAKAKVAEKRKAERAELAAKKAKKRPARKNYQAKSEHKANKPAKFNHNKPKEEKLELKLADFTRLEKGSKVRVKVGDNAKSATVIEVLKDSARVELENGLVINLTSDRLFA